MRKAHLFHANGYLDFIESEFRSPDTFFIVLKGEDVDEIRAESNQQIVYLKDNEVEEFLIEKEIKVLFIEFLCGRKAQLISKLTYKPDLVWMIWGGDLYNAHFGYQIKDFLEPKSIDLLKKEHPKGLKGNVFYRKNSAVKRSILGKVYKVGKGEEHFYFTIEKVLKQLKACCGFPFETAMVKNRFPNIKEFEYTFGSVETYTSGFDVDAKEEAGEFILIGNSASVVNNHADVFEHLELDRHKCIVPLSYGDMEYADLLSKRYPHENLEYLREFLSLEDYTKVLTKCNTFILNSKRQHAVGNIILALQLGMRVYLNAKNPFYEFLKSKGILVFDFQKDFNRFENKLLSKEELEQNKMALETYWGKEKNSQRVQKISTFFS